MANIKSAMKRAKVIHIRTRRNAAYRSMMKTAIRRFETALKSGDKEKAGVELKKAIRTIDRIETKGVIHKNTANRKKSRLTKAFNRAS
ncbi:MAG: 30S ribosomal protein S20 [Peptococcaceae bacterium]|jgi:small subunit ribosomal protein S20|nr:30S ribosomal protein S20 [Peptococcaceae bacterium]